MNFVSEAGALEREPKEQEQGASRTPRDVGEGVLSGGVEMGPGGKRE